MITVFRRDTYLGEAVRSALAQTYGNVEVIVTEDGGSDCAEHVIRAIDDPRVRHRRNPVNLGESGNRFAAYAEARGEYIVNLDDDDLLDPNMVERLIRPLLADERVVIAFADHRVVREDGRVDATWTEESTHRWGRDRLRGGLHASLWRLGVVESAIPFAVSALFRRSVVRDAAAGATGAGSVDDLFLGYLVSRTGGYGYYVPERLASYRIHAGQESLVGRIRTSRGQQYCFATFLADRQLAAYRPMLRRRWADATVSLGAELLLSGDRTAARAQFWTAARHAESPRAVAGLLLTCVPLALARHAIRAFRARPRARST